MQDIHSIGGGGGGGRLFGGDGGSDRRLRPHNHQKNHQALRCPRCDSLNTKFCYYNNYNLSQPRHFCKCCRRYWTIGGVLRNVPVGSGCRKTKRSNPKQKPTSSASTTTNLQHRQQRQREQPKSSNSHSSSESSSLTATNTASTTVDNTNNTLNGGVGESKLFSIADSSFNPIMEARLQLAEQGSSDCVIFSEIESFASLIDASNEQLGFGFSHLLDQQGLDQDQHGTGQNQDQPWQHQHQKMLHVDAAEMKMQGVVCDGRGGGGLIDDDQMVQDEYSKFGALDWQGTGDHGVLDLHAAVDQAYWSSQS